MIDLDKFVLQPAMQAFGEPVQYLPSDGRAFATTAVFDERYRNISYRDGAEVIDTHPVLGVRAALFPDRLPAQGDLWSVRGRLYLQRSPAEADGHGHLKILLRYADDQQALLPEVLS